MKCEYCGRVKNIQGECPVCNNKNLQNKMKEEDCEMNTLIDKDKYLCSKCGTELYKYRTRPGLYCDKCKKYYYNSRVYLDDTEIKLETDKGFLK